MDDMLNTHTNKIIIATNLLSVLIKLSTELTQAFISKSLQKAFQLTYEQFCKSVYHIES